VPFTTAPQRTRLARGAAVFDSTDARVAAAIDLRGREANGARERYLAPSEHERAILLSCLGNL
jgi:hypothetical protein